MRKLKIGDKIVWDGIEYDILDIDTTRREQILFGWWSSDLKSYRSYVTLWDNEVKNMEGLLEDPKFDAHYKVIGIKPMVIIHKFV